MARLEKLTELSEKKTRRGFRTQRCDGCRLPPDHCICRYRPFIRTTNRFWILMHPKEKVRATNTGRIVKDCLSGAEIFDWNRVTAPSALVSSIESNRYSPYLVMHREEAKQKRRWTEFEQTPGTVPAFILFDGRWRQARRMFNRSAYLEGFPVLSLDVREPSCYQLRRASDPDRLSTVEAVIELLKLADEDHGAFILNCYFRVFTYTYLSSLKKIKMETPEEDMATLEAYREKKVKK